MLVWIQFSAVHGVLSGQKAAAKARAAVAGRGGQVEREGEASVGARTTVPVASLPQRRR